MATDDDDARIKHMRDAAQQIAEFIGGRTRADLDEDFLLMYALAKVVEIIGEAANRVTAETRSVHPEVPWQDAARMRHKLVHDYDDIDLDTLWDTVTVEVPVLLSLLDGLIDQGAQ